MGSYFHHIFHLILMWRRHEKFPDEGEYRKPPTISSGLIYFRKRFLMGLYKGGGGGLYIRVGLYMDDLLC